MAELVDKAILDDSDYLKSLKRMDSGMDKVFKDANGRLRDVQGRFISMGKAGEAALGGVGKAGQSAFGGIGKSAELSGVKIGVVSGAVQEITRRLIDLGATALRVFAQFTQESVGMAADLETTGQVFTGIFQGNEQAAVAALARIREESRGLGVDLSETARAFLPFVQNLDQLSRVGKLAAGLALSQPEQGEQGARIALQEFLSGNAGSLVKRFEIPKNLGKELNETLATEGVEAGIAKLEEIMKRMGRDVENLGDTFQLSLGKAKISAEQLQTAFGIPITDELKSQLDELNKVVEANFDDFEGLATLAGQVISEIAGAADLSGIAQFFADNKQGIAEFLTALQEIVKSAKELVDIDLSKGLNVNALTDAALKLNKIVEALNTIKTITESSDTSALANAFTGGLEGVFPLYSAFITIWENLDEVILAVIATYGLFIATAAAGQAELNNAYQELLVFTGQIEESQKKLIDPQKAYKDSVAETNKAIAEYKANVQEAADTVSRATIPVKESTDAGLAQADAFLEQAEAARKLAEAEEEAEVAQAKVNEARAEAEKDHDRKLEDIDIAAERKRLDIAIEFAQKREDAAQDHLDKITDIRKKNSQDIDDAATDLERSEEDIARKFADSRIDLEKEQRQKRLDVETDYRKKLQDIQSQFLLDAEDAERSRDAVGFLKAMRERDQKVSEAQVDRTREIDETRITGQQKLDELRVQRERELEEARIANERKLEDLALNLDRQIEAQNTAYARQLDDLATGEARKNEEAARKREEDIEDANRAYDRKLEDLKLSLAAELAIIAEGNAALEAEQARHNAAMEGQSNSTSSSRSQRPSTTGGDSAGFGDTPDSIGSNRNRTYNSPNFQSGGSIGGGGSDRPSRSSTRRAFGGLVNAGQSYPVGERGPELFTPSSNGKIIPSNQLVMPSFTPKSNVNSISNSRNQEINLPMVNGSQLLDAVFISKLRNIIRSELEGLV